MAFASALVGVVRGGLAMVNVGMSLFFAEVSGSAVADVGATGSVLTPAMKGKGYSARFAAALTLSTASLAIIIPPSIPMILYGAPSNTSIVQLFVAGIVPGLLGASLPMAPRYDFAVRYDLPREESPSLRRLGTAIREAAWALLLPAIILGGIFGGLVTATEGAGLAVLAALLIGLFVHRELSFAKLDDALVDGVLQTAIVMLLVAASAVLGLYLTETRMPQTLAAGITGVSENPFLVLMTINVFLLLVGMVLHGAAAIILTVPIFMPLVNQLGIDPVRFGILPTVNIALGQQTPPVASVLITACSIVKTDVWATTEANLPVIGVFVAILLRVTYVPAVPLRLVGCSTDRECFGGTAAGAAPGQRRRPRRSSRRRSSGRHLGGHGGCVASLDAGRADPADVRARTVAPTVCAMVSSDRIVARGRSMSSRKPRSFAAEPGRSRSALSTREGVIDSSTASRIEHRNETPMARTTKRIRRAMGGPGFGG